VRALALKVDVDTWHGTRDGVPRLVEILRRHQARATFLFSLGPDHTGRAIRRVFRRGFLSKVSRTSVLSHYGLATLLYGTLLPGPDIGRRGAEVMRLVREAGFEVGIHAWDHVRWQDNVAEASAAWTEREMGLAVERFRRVFGEAPRTHGAAGWQMNTHALRLTQRLGFGYCSDARGTHPFRPVHRAELIDCLQLPTTLPTLDELIGLDGVTEANVAESILGLTRQVRDHVFTLHAELEGMKLAPAFERLLDGWKEQGYRIVAMRELHEGLEPAGLPLHSVLDAPVPGRSGTLACQGPAFLPSPSTP
jgi:peptidoglycan/xylan/chitin deacetylase (PgdA/CDA1 family)